MDPDERWILFERYKLYIDRLDVAMFGERDEVGCAVVYTLQRVQSQ
jgi:hypothetical protein